MKSTSRRWAAPLAIVASAAIFAVSAFAASGNLSAYNSFKDSLITSMSRNETMPENYTLTSVMNASYDGEQLMTARSVNKVQGDYTSSNSTTVEGPDINCDIASWNWKEGNTHYSVDKNVDDVYTRYKYENAYAEWDEAYSYDATQADMGPTNTEVQFVSALIDTLMGDTKNYFTVDGDYTVVNLEGGQIPELIQLGMGMVMESSDFKVSNDKHLDVFNKITGLKNHRIDAVYVRMLANDGAFDWMTDTTFSVKISGQDGNGIRHTLTMDGNMKADQQGTTVADPVVDLTGKNVVDADMTDSYTVTSYGSSAVGFAEVATVTVTDSER